MIDKDFDDQRQCYAALIFKLANIDQPDAIQNEKPDNKEQEEHF